MCWARCVTGATLTFECLQTIEYCVESMAADISREIERHSELLVCCWQKAKDVGKELEFAAIIAMQDQIYRQIFTKVLGQFEDPPAPDTPDPREGILTVYMVRDAGTMNPMGVFFSLEAARDEATRLGGTEEEPRAFVDRFTMGKMRDGDVCDDVS